MTKKGVQPPTHEAAIIVVGAGLAGLVAVHSIIEAGGRAVLIEKSDSICPPAGNAALTATGISGAGTRVQAQHEEMDSVSDFLNDVVKSGVKKSELLQTLCEHSGDGIDWLSDTFGIPFVLSRSAGHSVPRTHKCKSGASGYVITEALARSALVQSDEGKLLILTGTKVQSLIRNDRTGEIQGVVFEKDAKLCTLNGPVVLATGGFGADFASSSLLGQYRPDLFGLSTACNLSTSTGDGIKMAEQIGAKTVDMMYVQLNPTGLVDEMDPINRMKLLASQSLRGDGGIILDRFGNRFVNELSKRDMLSQELLHNAANGPFRIVLNSRMSGHLKDHVAEYIAAGLMLFHPSGADLAAKMALSTDSLAHTFERYNEVAKTKNTDEFGKEHFRNCPFEMADSFHSALIEPVIHYCNGGLVINSFGEVMSKGKSVPIANLYAAGEVTGGIHSSVNPLAGNDLLDCVVFGRIAGITAARNLYGSDYVDGFIDPATIQVNLEKRIAEQEGIEAKLSGDLAATEAQVADLKSTIKQQQGEVEKLAAASGCLNLEDAKGMFANVREKRSKLEVEVEAAKKSIADLTSSLSEKRAEVESVQKRRRTVVAENEKLIAQIEALRESSSVIRDIHALEQQIEECRQRQVAAESERAAGEQQLALQLAASEKERAELIEKRDQLYVMMQLDNVENKQQMDRLRDIAKKWKPCFAFEQQFAAKSLILAQNTACPVFQKPYRIL